MIEPLESGVLVFMKLHTMGGGTLSTGLALTSERLFSLRAESNYTTPELKILGVWFKFSFLYILCCIIDVTSTTTIVDGRTGSIDLFQSDLPPISLQFI